MRVVTAGVHSLVEGQRSGSNSGRTREAFQSFGLALEHRSLVWYFMIVFALAGVFSYLGLGREEDPNFTIKTMVIQANWRAPAARKSPSR